MRRKEEERNALREEKGACLWPFFFCFLEGRK